VDVHTLAVGRRRGSPVKRFSSPRGPGARAKVFNSVKSDNRHNCTHSDVAFRFFSSMSVVVDTARSNAESGSTLYGNTPRY
jgi:hypothetical protein